MDMLKLKSDIEYQVDMAKKAGVAIVANSKFLSSTSAKDVVGEIFGIVIAVVFIAAAIPTAITAITGANTDGWGVATVAMWGLLSIVIVVIVVLMLYNNYGRGKTGGRGPK